MADAKKKPKIQASDVEVGSRKLESVLLDLAEQAKANNERMARVDDRSARAEELATIALQTIAAVTKDLRVLAQRTDDRLKAPRESRRSRVAAGRAHPQQPYSVLDGG